MQVERPVISFTAVDFAYGNIPVLKNVDFAARTGDFVAMVGPNGGGKTTILKLILGTLAPVRGDIRIFGETPDPLRQGKRIGYMPQSLKFDAQFPITVFEVVLLGRMATGHGWRFTQDDRHAATMALAETGQQDLAERQFNSLSGGQRQRVLLARALVGEPELLLLDEPTANIDAEVENHLHELLLKLNRRMTVLLVSHDLGFVSSLAERVICVNRNVVIHPTRELSAALIHEHYPGENRLVCHDQVHEETKQPHA